MEGEREVWNAGKYDVNVILNETFFILPSISVDGK